jgi:hypothetical protein
MAKLILEGGTDVAEVALFSLDALPEQLPDGDGIEALEQQGLLVRMPTGADGGYLVHVYADEPLPDDLLRHLSPEGGRRRRLVVREGGVGFGGLESVYSGFAPNAAIRSDGALPAGEYEARVYRAEFPDSTVPTAIASSLGKQAMRHLAVPVQIVVLALSLAAGAVLLRAWLALLVIALGAAAAIRMYLKHPATEQLRRQRREIERQFPSLVVELRSLQS